MSPDNQPGLARLWPVGKFTLITLTALAAATALSACTRYNTDTTSDEIFSQHEEIPDSWQNGEDASDTANEPSATGANDGMTDSDAGAADGTTDSESGAADGTTDSEA
nr:hypothetical protein [Gammaproteobacteria bacterium]